MKGCANNPFDWSNDAFFSLPKQKASNYDLLEMHSYMLPENLNFTRLAESNELPVKRPLMVLPQPSLWAGNCKAQV